MSSRQLATAVAAWPTCQTAATPSATGPGPGVRSPESGPARPRRRRTSPNLLFALSCRCTHSCIHESQLSVLSVPVWVHIPIWGYSLSLSHRRPVSRTSPLVLQHSPPFRLPSRNRAYHDISWHRHQTTNDVRYKPPPSSGEGLSAHSCSSSCNPSDRTMSWFLSFRFLCELFAADCGP